MKKIFLLLSLVTYSLSLIYAQQPIPAKAESKSILLINGTVHLGNGKVVSAKWSGIGIKDGKIIEIDDSTTNKRKERLYDTTIDCSGKQIYPGFIATDCTLGLVETESVRASTDVADIGFLNPELRSLIAYNTDSRITPVVRMNGILTAQITPRGGLISGTSSILSLDGWNWEDAAYKKDDGIHVNWPSLYTRTWLNEDQMGGFVANKNYDKQAQMLQKFLEDAKGYFQQKSHDEMDIKLEAMKGVFSGTKTLFIHAESAKEILASITAAKNLSIPKVVLVGGRDSWMLTDFLKQNNVAVIVGRLHELPAMPDDDIDLPYKLPGLLQKAGVLFCLDNTGDMEQNETRNLPFLAGTAATYGLTQEDAIKAITLNTAKILGIDDHLGSLEEGKDATLFISTGDALDMRTNNVTMAFINGKSIQLTSVQTALYHKYHDKYSLK